MLSLFDLFDGSYNNQFPDKSFLETPENIDAITKIRQFISHPQNYLPTALLLIGAECSGKTHLLHHIFNNKQSSYQKKFYFIDLENFFIDGFNKNYLANNVANNFYIIEDCTQFNLANKTEKLLHLINFILENLGFIIISSTSLPNFSLADLQSRIINFHQANIIKPSIETAKMLIANHMSYYQIKINRNLLNQLENYQNFSYRQINDLAKILLFFSQEKNKMPNLQEFNNILKSQQQIQQ